MVHLSRSGKSTVQRGIARIAEAERQCTPPFPARLAATTRRCNSRSRLAIVTARQPQPAKHSPLITVRCRGGCRAAPSTGRVASPFRSARRAPARHMAYGDRVIAGTPIICYIYHHHHSSATRLLDFHTHARACFTGGGRLPLESNSDAPRDRFLSSWYARKLSWKSTESRPPL